MSLLRYIWQTRRFASTKTIFSSPPPKLTKSQLRDLTTTDLLIRLGFIKQPHAGITHWLPLGLATLNSLESVIRKRLDEAGVLEVSLSALSHSSLWHKTQRWDNEELYKLNDEFCLAATAEEEITSLVSSYADTYHKLPVSVYQMTRKYRDEKRPRGGLLRGREFIMKDAYSFNTDKKGALHDFDTFNRIYRKIFTDLRVPFVKANADTGSIGGDLSYEWHFVSDKGEDTLYTCDHCHVTGNVEKVRPYMSSNDAPADKADVTYYLTKQNDLVAIYYPQGRHLNMKFLASEDLVDLNTKIVNQKKVLEIFKAENEKPDGFHSIIRIIDVCCKPGTLMPDMPVPYNKSRMTTFEGLELTEAQEGDLCSSCQGKGHLHASKGIEIGHTFYLGQKYSKPLEATYMDQDGKKQYYEMGCYGIGVSRLLGAIAECMRDSKGLRWPAIIAPLQVSVIKSPSFGEASTENEALINHFIGELKRSGVRAEVDDSDLRMGMKLNKSKQIGVPLQVIIGRSFPKLEIEVRGELFEDKGLKEIEKNGKDWGFENKKLKGIHKYLVDIKHGAKAVKLLLTDM